MTRPSKAIPLLFLAAALYDGLLGLAFLVAAAAVFDWAGVTPPNHVGYVHFPAALLVVFAVMFLMIARKPNANRDLIPYGIMLKASYAGVVIYHWIVGGIPLLWKPFAVVDIMFLVLFVMAYRALGKQAQAERSI